MLRSILGVIAGIFAGGFVVFLMELPGMFLHPLPKDIDWQDAQAMSTHVQNAPVSLKALVLAAWAVGPFVAALVACCIVKRAYVGHALTLGVVFALLDLANIVQFPHPWWMVIGGLAFPPVTALLGARLAQRLCPAPRGGPQPYDMREKNMAC